MKKSIYIKRAAALLLALVLLTALCPVYAADEPVASDELARFVADQEGFHATPYLDSDGLYRIGHGTSCGAADYPDGITEEVAFELLKAQLDVEGAAVLKFLTNNGVEFTAAQFDALVSFTFNVGSGWLYSDCRLASALKNGVEGYSDVEVVDFFGVWCHVGKEVWTGLVNRRVAEACIFLYGDYSGARAAEFTWLTLDENGGELENDIAFYKKGEAYSVLPAASMEGFYLAGWKTESGSLLSASASAGAPEKVTAVWSDISAWKCPFSDVPAGAWYFNYVRGLTVAGVVDGYPDGTFLPQGEVTLGAALKLILIAAGTTDALPAKNGHWAGGYLELALSRGVISEADAAGGLDAPAGRLLIAKIAAGALGLGSSLSASPFADTDDGYAVALYEIGIVEGSVENGQRLYKPQNAISRAEVSAIVSRIIEK